MSLGNETCVFLVSLDVADEESVRLVEYSGLRQGADRFRASSPSRMPLSPRVLSGTACLSAYR